MPSSRWRRMPPPWSRGTLTAIDVGAPEPAAPDDANGLATLRSKIEADWPIAGLLHGVLCATSLDEALAARSRLAAGKSVITAQGVWLGPAWLHVRRGGVEEYGVLEREQALEALGREIERTDADVQAHEQAARETLRGAPCRRGGSRRRPAQPQRGPSPLRRDALRAHRPDRRIRTGGPADRRDRGRARGRRLPDRSRSRGAGVGIRTRRTFVERAVPSGRRADAVGGSAGARGAGNSSTPASNGKGAHDEAPCAGTARGGDAHAPRGV